MMSRTIAVTLLLLFLMVSITSERRIKRKHLRAEFLEFISIGFKKSDIVRCRCNPTGTKTWSAPASSKMLCPRPLIPTSASRKADLKNCLCRRNCPCGQKPTTCLPRSQEFCQSKCPILRPAPIL